MASKTSCFLQRTKVTPHGLALPGKKNSKLLSFVWFGIDKITDLSIDLRYFNFSRLTCKSSGNLGSKSSTNLLSIIFSELKVELRVSL